MKTSTITKTLGVLALLASSASMAATITITPSSAIVAPGQTFTMTIAGDPGNTVAGSLALAFDATRVNFVSIAALSPFTFCQRSTAIQLDCETPAATPVGAPPFNIAQVTFQALANAPGGSAGIVINDDGGNATGWFDEDTGNPIAVNYIQGNVQIVPIPAAAWLFVSALGGLAALRRRAAL